MIPTPAPGTLDHEYNTRLWARDFEQTLDAHRRWGEAARALPGARLNLRWGHRPRQTLDLFLPTQASGPLFVFIHGGYWQYRSSGKDSVSFLAPDVLGQQVAYAAVQYELCPDLTMDEMVAQLRQALLWIVETCPALAYQPTRITVGGHSAGGHLAAMLALTDWEHHGARADLIAGACCISGLYELEPLVSTYVNTALRMDEAMARRVSPTELVRPGRLAFVLAAGERESGQFKRQTQSFAARLEAAGHQVESLIMLGRDHYDVIRELVDAQSPLRRAATRLMLGHSEAMWQKDP